jgi:serine/threonine protein kinase
VKKLGSGSFGSVMKGKCLKSGQSVAIKYLKNTCKTEYDCVKMLREIQIMKELTKMVQNHQGTLFPKLIDLIIPSSNSKSENPLSHIFIIMEMMDTDIK